MPIRGSPNGAGYLRPQAGRDRPESVVAINRNGWSQSIGMAGRDRPVRAGGADSPAKQQVAVDRLSIVREAGTTKRKAYPYAAYRAPAQRTARFNCWLT
jgi:hypothetical protein